MHAHHHAEGDLHGMAAGRFLGAALAATLCLVIAEFAGGHFGHSIALTSDALHNLSDIRTIVIAWLAVRWSERPADARDTYGYRRAGGLAAFTNGILLATVALALLWESLQRFLHPVAVHEQWMIWLSLVALAINGG